MKKLQSLILSIFGKVDNEIHLRVNHTTLEEPENAIGPNSGETFNSLLSKAITLDHNGNPVLRIATCVAKS